jgi:hypothetical protein
MGQRLLSDLAGGENKYPCRTSVILSALPGLPPPPESRPAMEALRCGATYCQIIHTPRRVVEPRSCGWGPRQGVRLCAEQIFPEESAEAENSGGKGKTQKTVTSTNLSCR